MERKVFVLGVSLVITIPQILAEIHGVEKGMKLKLEETEEGLLLRYPEKVMK